MLRPLVHWLAATQASESIKAAAWIVPTVQVVHILAISALISSVLMIDLRIWGLAGRSQPMGATARRFLPWAWTSVGVLAVTGAIMIVGEPERELDNPSFWIKMTLLAIGLLATGLFQATVHRNIAFWETSSGRRRIVGTAAALILLVWLGIIICGRFIAYTQNG